jgi:hypothetical protein
VGAKVGFFEDIGEGVGCVVGEFVGDIVVEFLESEMGVKSTPQVDLWMPSVR